MVCKKKRSSSGYFLTGLQFKTEEQLNVSFYNNANSQVNLGNINEDLNFKIDKTSLTINLPTNTKRVNEANFEQSTIHDFNQEYSYSNVTQTVTTPYKNLRYN